MKNIEITALDLGESYVNAELTERQMDSIRVIVREEIRAALKDAQTPSRGWEPF